ncbi:hypothetical protein ElyMa_000556500 [Elysia marginata]|uniref:Peptidase C1A papain C-terminal domain-containing protein n=1 Tax=Elysia marginata TaxID=1093978 RepID=A0AAV4G2R3_9GAST|nr:hypothetical protein ElyMa_000556500 [Elysia marginata]
MSLITQLTCVCGLLLVWSSSSDAHGRLWDPPSRSSMWRRGFNVPANYQDNELFCGGFTMVPIIETVRESGDLPFLNALRGKKRQTAPRR